ncbi:MULTISPECIES: hypothetical protein [unclassified Coprococcus]|jgi:hypothetical protein|uniref:hypothetical protein n=1 Tax=unclassified Coprococcus TaxID=2684943 RepID=UPI000E51A0BF|nr:MULTISPECIES: hypothetical protein [unclassified Coprococcus]RGG98469.1 hypothetical protein DWW60_08605 [Coprococcus sp. AF16-22]RGI34007.1 hypothetical protein DXB91_12055 [Coprococcus sp. OM06-34AC]RGI41394.1 hypothetical protein DXB88_09215 [Coprococcus sp. OM06-25]RHR64937.1 hypothetical protein DWW70_12335 [Coprococcus sp. AF16-5]
MGIRKGIFIGAAMLSIMACTACGNSGGNVSETNSAETSTGVESGIIEQPQVMYDGHIYYYNATGRDEKLPEGYEIAGTIKRVDSKDYPAENFAAAGVDLEAGQEIYISTTEKNVIYLKYDSGYARFERRPEEATEKAQDETKSAEKENEIEGNSEMTAYMDASMEEDYGEDGEFDFDSIFGIDQLDLNYEAHVAGFDGESFLYSVHIDGGVTDEKVDEIQQVMADYSSQNGDEENYMGYIDIYNGEDQIMIYLDLGGVSEENSNMAVTGILNALNSVSGIKSVIINEGM